MRRLCSTLLATIVVIFGVLSFSQAAHAADGTLSITSSATTIAPGDTVNLTWESTGVIDLGHFGSWQTSFPDGPSGSIPIQLDYPGIYYFGIDGFHEDDDQYIEDGVEIIVSGDIISVTAQCEAFTITNLLDINVGGIYGDLGPAFEYDFFELGPGESQTFDTDLAAVDFSFWHVLDGEQELLGIGIPRNCNDNSDDGGNNGGSSGDGFDNGSATGAGNASGHPTVAPAAGIADANVGASPLAAGIALLIGATIAARRLRI